MEISTDGNDLGTRFGLRERHGAKQDLADRCHPGHRQASPHSRVSCVECHIGSGAKWYAKSKLSGARQFLAVTFDTYSKPIETPIRGLRPARETCEECHHPELFSGEKL